ncbi:MAG: ferredoxin reductase family protein [bacterium]
MTTMDAPPRPAVTSAGPRLRPTPPWWRLSSRDLALGSLLLVTALWATDHQSPALTQGWAPALTSLGRLTGLLAADLLLIQVLLMARIPFVERAWGQDELVRVHRLVGFTSFNLMAAHVVMITLGYAGSDGHNPVAESWLLTWTYPGMLLAAAGTLALIMVVATSVRLARRRLRYEAWHLLHLYAYLGVGLALPHQLWTGAEFLNNRLATAYWWSAWAATASAVLLFRVALPIYRTLRHRLVVEAVVPEAPGVMSLHMRGRNLDALPVRAGQFFLFRFLDEPGRTRAHPFSLSAAPRPSWMRVTVKALGDDSRLLASLRPGGRVAIEGPYGGLTAERRTHRGVLLIGAGVGITPLRALAEELPQEPGDVVVIHRIRDDGEVLFAGEFQALARARQLRMLWLSGPRPQGRPSWAPASYGGDGTAVLRSLVPDVAQRDVYVCGPAEWMAAALDAARAAGVPQRHLHAERFGW